MSITPYHLFPQAQAQVLTHKSCARLFFTGFAQDGKLLEQLLTAQGSALQHEDKDTCAKRASCSLEHYPDVFILSHYAQDLDAEALAAASANGTEVLAELCLLLEPLKELISGYERFEVLAWSFGVRAALSLLGALDAQSLVGKSIKAKALCGTPFAVDANYGIAPEIYNRMYRAIGNARLADKTMQGFARQLSSNEHIQSAYINYYHQASKAELKNELYMLPHLKLPEGAAKMGALGSSSSGYSNSSASHLQLPFTYEQVFLSTDDAIFTPDRALTAWEHYGLRQEQIACTAGEHLNLSLMHQLLHSPVWD